MSDTDLSPQSEIPTTTEAREPKPVVLTQGATIIPAKRVPGPVFGDTRYTHVGYSACPCTPGLVLIAGNPERCAVCGGPHDSERVLPVSDGWVFTAETKNPRGRLTLQYSFAPDWALAKDPELAKQVDEAKGKRRMQGGCLEVP